MKLENLTSPGIIPNSQKLRTEALKGINFVQVTAMNRGHGSTHATALSAFAAAVKAAADALVYVPVTGVTVGGAGAVAVGSTRQLTATTAPVAGYSVIWSSADTTKVVVDQRTGLVRRIAAGTVVVTATSMDDPSKTGTGSIT